MSSVMTRWSVLHEHTVGPADRDPDGEVADAAVDRWVERACADYLGQCTGLQDRVRREGLTLAAAAGHHPRGVDLRRATRVVVSASATEVLPEAFVLALRVRGLDGDDDVAVNATRTIRVLDRAGTVQPVDDAIRDELIALEHAARHFN